MTRESYFEMCELLGSEPIEEEIPVDYDDLPLEVQQTLLIYNSLQDCWDYMGGNYIGKNISCFKDVLDLFDVDPLDRRYIYELIIQIDSIRAKIIQKEASKNKKPAK